MAVSTETNEMRAELPDVKGGTVVMETIYDVPYNGESAWAYRLDNTVTGKWYIGISKQPVDSYTTSSENTELLSAISNGEVDRHIIHVDGSYPAMEIWETENLTFLNPISPFL